MASKEWRPETQLESYRVEGLRMSLLFSGCSLMACSSPLLRHRMIQSFSSASSSLAVSGPLGSKNCNTANAQTSLPMHQKSLASHQPAVLGPWLMMRVYLRYISPLEVSTIGSVYPSMLGNLAF
jgi:hypothetical protein